jgi:hypothetical protein
MTAFNVVRFRTKPGMENAFIEAHERASFKVTGFRRGALVKTGDRMYCFIGEWDNMDNLTAARPLMIATLDSFRGLLEDLGSGLGVTDPVSGPAVADLPG